MKATTLTNGLDVSRRVLPWVERGAVVAAKGAVSEAGRRWVCGLDRPFAMVQAALQTLARSGEGWAVLPGAESYLDWAVAVSGLLAEGRCDGVVFFGEDPAVVACVANRMPRVRAAAVSTVNQCAKATLGLGANLVAVEMPGRTFFEIRYILQTVRSSRLGCPGKVAEALAMVEESHASR